MLDEIAATIPFFAGAVQPIPATGVDLRANLLAGVNRDDSPRCSHRMTQVDAILLRMLAPR